MDQVSQCETVNISEGHIWAGDIDLELDRFKDVNVLEENADEKRQHNQQHDNNVLVEGPITLYKENKC